jgi:hypothetical protein
VLKPASALDRGRGDVDAEDVPERGGAAGLARRLARAAADVEHAFARTNAGRRAEMGVMEAQLGVVARGVHRAVMRGRERSRLAP